ncbi:hypothetical protein ACHAWF_008373 [Thalassiosira exigua]
MASNLSLAFQRRVLSTRKIKCRSVSTSALIHDPRYVNVSNAPQGFDPSSAVVYPDFLTEDEGRSLIKEVSRRLKRRRFEDGHWDSVITGYREVELPTPDENHLQQPHGGVPSSSSENDSAMPMFAKVIQKTRKHLAAHHFSRGVCDNVKWLPCHAIDLSADGVLSAHVDSVKFSGEIVACLSLLSDSIMRLRPSSKEWSDDGTESDSSDRVPEMGCSDSRGYVDLYLPQLSLYVLSSMSRFHYTHELLQSGSSFQFLDRDGSTPQLEDSTAGKEINVQRGRRLSIIFRDMHRDAY